MLHLWLAGLRCDYFFTGGISLLFFVIQISSKYLTLPISELFLFWVLACVASVESGKGNRTEGRNKGGFGKRVLFSFGVFLPLPLPGIFAPALQREVTTTEIKKPHQTYSIPYSHAVKIYAQYLSKE